MNLKLFIFTLLSTFSLFSMASEELITNHSKISESVLFYKGSSNYRLVLSGFRNHDFLKELDISWNSKHLYEGEVSFYKNDCVVKQKLFSCVASDGVMNLAGQKINFNRIRVETKRVVTAHEDEATQFFLEIQGENGNVAREVIEFRF